MRYRPLGRTGFDVSEISFGAWAIGGSWGNVSDDESLKALHRAIDRGVNFIDTASRVLWQHGLTPEEAVRVCHKTMEPRVDRALAGMMNGGDIDVGTGPMREVRPGEAQGYYAEVVKSGDEDGDPLASFIAPPPTGPMPPRWEDDGDDNDIPVQWLPRDPRGK